MISEGYLRLRFGGGGGGGAYFWGGLFLEGLIMGISQYKPYRYAPKTGIDFVKSKT